MKLLIILLVLFAALALTIPLIERHASPLNPEQQQRLSRWILPLVGLSLILALIKHLLS